MKTEQDEQEGVPEQEEGLRAFKVEQSVKDRTPVVDILFTSAVSLVRREEGRESWTGGRGTEAG